MALVKPSDYAEDSISNLDSNVKDIEDNRADG
jgi:hypothetical protein